MYGDVDDVINWRNNVKIKVIFDIQSAFLTFVSKYGEVIGFYYTVVVYYNNAGNLQCL